MSLELQYKPDWEMAKQRYLAWWEGEIIDRCAISVFAPKAGAPPEEPPALPARVEDRWLDYDYLAALNDFWMRHTFYGGEAFPVWSPGYPGWGFIPSFLGSRVTLDEDTGWVYPILDHGDLTDYDYRTLTIAPDNPWWVRAQEMLRFSVEQARGKSIPTIGAIGGCGDTLAALRGSEQLLYDLTDCPEYVREFELYLMRQWIDVYEQLYQIIHEASEGSTCWFPLWSPGKFYAAQNDFAYMISPEMFNNIFLPSIEMQTQYLDHTVYHVDGIGNFAHVDALCTLPRLQAIQILPGAGKPSPLYYLDVLKKVQAAGKNLQIYLDPREVEEALRELSPYGLMIHTYCASEEEARDLLRNVEKWTVQAVRS
ncbi:MAG: hypothetical protein ACYDBB_23075 [Armatimonadota bacterium]